MVPPCGDFFFHPLGELLGLSDKLGLGLLDAVQGGKAQGCEAGEHQRPHHHGDHREAEAPAH